jgi:2-dehydro-3-deoxygluconokinase
VRHRTGHILTLGESMALLHPVDSGRLHDASRMVAGVAGADSNFAIAMARLGWPAIWLSAVSQDPLGDLVVETVGAAGVDVSRVRRDPDHGTGVFFRFREAGASRVLYYRSGSAASHFDPDWLEPSLFERAAALHINGVTCALSDSCAASVIRAVALANQYGVSISLDANLRLQLWNIERARATLIPLFSRVDIVLGTEEELLALSGRTQLDDALTDIAAHGPTVVVAKRGPLGAVALAGGKRMEHRGFVAPVVVDEVGAGDGFAAGFVSALFCGAPVEDALRDGNLIGAAAVTVADDVSAYPTQAQLEAWVTSWPARGLTAEPAAG